MLFDLEESGERVERMIEGGRKIMREAIDLYKPCAIFACYSSGNDSIVSTHFAVTEFGGHVAMVDTLTGIRRSREHAVEVCSQFGWSIEIKQAMPEGPPKTKRDGSPFNPSIDLASGVWTDGETAYEDFCFNFGLPMRGKKMHQRMYQRLKERGFESLKRDAKHGQHRRATVMFVSGIRQDESAVRAGYQRAVQKVKDSSSIWVNPFYFNSAADFECYRQEFGLPRNPVSQIVGISGECCCGTFAKDGEISLIEQAEPSHAEYLRGLETRCESLGLPCKWGAEQSKKTKQTPLDNQLNLIFGDEPDFMPACVGCVRRNAS